MRCFLVMTNFLQHFLPRYQPCPFRSFPERSSDGKPISSYANPFSMIFLIYATFSGIYWLTLVNISAGRTWKIIRKTCITKNTENNNN